MKSIRLCSRCQYPWGRHVAHCPGCGRDSGWGPLLRVIGWAAGVVALLVLMAGGRVGP